MDEMKKDIIVVICLFFSAFLILSACVSIVTMYEDEYLFWEDANLV